MSEDLRARIECALGLHPAIRDGQTVPLADAVMEIVQPIADELAENEGVIKALRRQRDQAEAERDRLAARVAELERPEPCADASSGSTGYAGTSDRNPDGTCPDWCPCHRLKEQL